MEKNTCLLSSIRPLPCCSHHAWGGFLATLFGMTAEAAFKRHVSCSWLRTADIIRTKQLQARGLCLQRGVSSVQLPFRAKPTYAIDPGNVGRHPGEHRGLPVDVTARGGTKTGHSTDVVLAIHQAVQRASRITLQSKAKGQQNLAHIATNSNVWLS